MPHDISKPSIRGCWNFWLANFKDANERWETIRSIFAGVVAIVILILKGFGIRIPALNLFLDSNASDWVGAICLAYAFLMFFIWLPYKRHQEHIAVIEKMQSEKMALVIHSAFWHAEGSIFNITEKALARLADGKFEMSCNKSDLGEPSEGHRKTLTIDFTCENKRAKRDFLEHEVARLP